MTEYVVIGSSGRVHNVSADTMSDAVERTETHWQNKAITDRVTGAIEHPSYMDLCKQMVE